MITAEREMRAADDTDAASTAATAVATKTPPAAGDGSRGAGTSAPSATMVAPAARIYPLPLAPTPAPSFSPTPSTPFPARPARRAALSQQGNRLRRSPMTLAVVVGTLVVALFCAYVYAYAQVTAAGFRASQLRQDLRKAESEELTLRAEISRLQMPDDLSERAARLSLELAPPDALQVLSPMSPTPPAAGGGAKNPTDATSGVSSASSGTSTNGR